MTTTNNELAFTEPVTYIATGCPEWCTDKPMHPCDNDYGDGVHSRYHTGPGFGPYLRVDAEEFTTEPGNVRLSCELYVDLPIGGQAMLTVEELRRLSEDAPGGCRVAWGASGMSARIRRRVADYRRHLRVRGYLFEVGPVVVTTWKRLGETDQKTWELGRDYQRGVDSGTIPPHLSQP